MKRLIQFLSVGVCFINYVLCTTYYVDSVNGNDSWTGSAGWRQGTTTVGPWKTINRVNNASLAGGDKVLFKRDCIWRSQQSLECRSGSSLSQPVIYSAYGNGDKPQIRTSVFGNKAENWINQGGNIWKLNAVLCENAALVIVNGDNYYGDKVFYYNELQSDFQFFSDESDNHALYMYYSGGNPGAAFSQIEISLFYNGIFCGDGSKFIEIKNLVMKYCGRSGLEIRSGHDITIRWCTMEYCGGGSYNGSARCGQGINTRFSVYNINIHTNSMKQCWDAGVALQGYTSGLTLNNIHIAGNIISKCHYGVEFWGMYANSSIRNIYIENNKFYNTGHGWSDNYRSKNNGTCIEVWNMNGECDNIVIEYNLFSGADDYILDIMSSSVNDHVDDFFIDYNTYQKTAGDTNPKAIIIEDDVYGTDEYNLSETEFNAWREKYDQDWHSQIN